MCKRRHTHDVYTAVPSEVRAYEGDTVRLNEPRPVKRHHCAGFPWWTLWLIWPMLGLLKATGERLPNIIGAMEHPFIVLQIGAAIVLIVVGVALLWREHRKGTSWPM